MALEASNNVAYMFKPFFLIDSLFLSFFLDAKYSNPRAITMYLTEPVRNSETQPDPVSTVSQSAGPGQPGPVTPVGRSAGPGQAG